MTFSVPQVGPDPGSPQAAPMSSPCQFPGLLGQLLGQLSTLSLCKLATSLTLVYIQLNRQVMNAHVISSQVA